MKEKMPYRRRLILPYKEFIEKVNAYHWQGLSDEELKASLKNSSERAKTYSLLKEIIFRCKGVTLFDSQIAAAYCMEEGKIAELPTGEGKTLAAVVTAAALALSGKQVHILVFNDYLAKRDYLDNRVIFQFCDLSCGCILQATAREKRQAAYQKKILYITAREAGFDDLRNFMAYQESELLEQSFQIAIVDEADSILLDEAGIPLVLAAEVPQHAKELDEIRQAVKALKAEDFDLREKEQQVWLTEKGAAHVEQLLGVKNLYEPENVLLLAEIHIMLEAELFYHRDHDYIVKNGQVSVIDENTGRIAEGRRFADSLHQAVEIKEGLGAKEATMIYNMMPLQFFLLKYQHLCGMTATAWSSRKELRTMYHVIVERIAPHVPCIRTDHQDQIVSTNQQLQTLAIEKIVQVHQRGQPLLICTQSVEESELFANLLRRRELPYSILNAKEDEREAELIARAGRPYGITISTNMAGRGVDIKLTGGAFTRQAGGLFVLCIGISRSLRVEQQLRGRAGRQGDPGESQLMISMEQELLKGFGQQKPSSKAVRQIQRMAEGEDAQKRYLLEKYSLILEKQRQIITQYRDRVLKHIAEVNFLKVKDPALYRICCAQSGEANLLRAEQQLLLYYINQHWADYLLTMEAARQGIHLAILGGEAPIDAYQKLAESAFVEMEEDIKADVLAKLESCTITENGVDLKAEGLVKATNTLTYAINESRGQFVKKKKTEYCDN